MHADIVELRQFYHTRLGLLAEQSVAMALSSIWASLPGERLMGLGYAAPYLDRFRPDAERTFAFMPAGQGAVNWPAGGPSATALVFDEELPLADASLDRILMVHSLEFAENPRETLKELWRVLAPGGRLVIVAPNRRGVWARFEHTPFGAGRPYSRGQLIRLLRESNFTPGAFAEALFFPPSERAVSCGCAGCFRAVWKAHVAGVFRRDRGRGAKAALSGPAGCAASLAAGVRSGAVAADLARLASKDGLPVGPTVQAAHFALSRQDRCKRLFPPRCPDPGLSASKESFR
jgi:SAM-dependent methyltransferase